MSKTHECILGVVGALFFFWCLGTGIVSWVESLPDPTTDKVYANQKLMTNNTFPRTGQLINLPAKGGEISIKQRLWWSRSVRGGYGGLK